MRRPHQGLPGVGRRSYLWTLPGMHSEQLGNTGETGELSDAMVYIELYAEKAPGPTTFYRFVYEPQGALLTAVLCSNRTITDGGPEFGSTFHELDLLDPPDRFAGVELDVQVLAAWAWGSRLAEIKGAGLAVPPPVPPEAMGLIRA